RHLYEAFRLLGVVELIPANATRCPACPQWAHRRGGEILGKLQKHGVNVGLGPMFLGDDPEPIDEAFTPGLRDSRHAHLPGSRGTRAAVVTTASEMAAAADALGVTTMMIARGRDVDVRGGRRGIGALVIVDDAAGEGPSGFDPEALELLERVHGIFVLADPGQDEIEVLI